MRSARVVLRSEIAQKSTTRLGLVADLHLFSRRSRAEHYLPQIRNVVRKSELFVLAGDTFDYKWAHQPCPDSFAVEAGSWLTDLAGESPHCNFQLLLGNHDHHPALMNRLNVLADQVPNFSWDPWFLRHGESIFLHGDVANGFATSQQLEKFRKRCENHQVRPGPIRNRIYDFIIASKLDRCATNLMFPARRVAQRITRYLEHIGHCAESGTRDVFFGHTHRPMSGYQYGKLRFHNPGAPIKGSPFRILETEI